MDSTAKSSPDLHFWTIIIDEKKCQGSSDLLAAAYSVHALGDTVSLDYDQVSGQLVVKQSNQAMSGISEIRQLGSESKKEEAPAIDRMIMVCCLDFPRLLPSDDRHAWVGVTSAAYLSQHSTSPDNFQKSYIMSSLTQHAVDWDWLPAKLSQLNLSTGHNGDTTPNCSKRANISCSLVRI